MVLRCRAVMISLVFVCSRMSEDTGLQANRVYGPYGNSDSWVDWFADADFLSVIGFLLVRKVTYHDKTGHVMRNDDTDKNQFTVWLTHTHTSPPETVGTMSFSS